MRLVSPASVYTGVSPVVRCSTPAVAPAPALSWTITDYAGTQVPFTRLEAAGEAGGLLTSAVRVSPGPGARQLSVTCTAENSLGYSLDTASVDLTCEYTMARAVGAFPRHAFAKRISVQKL